MLDETAVRIARSLTTVALQERRDQLDTAQRVLYEQMNSRNTLQSSMTMDQLRELGVANIAAATETAWQNLWRAISNLGVPVDVGDLKRELNDQLLPHLGHIDSLLEREGGRLYGGTPSGVQHTSQSRRLLRQAFERATAKAAVEIDLFVESRRRQATATATATPAAGSPIFNIYSPVGAILTGERAAASVIHTLGNVERGAVVGALEQFRVEVATQTRVPETTRAEVLELIDDGRSELKKERPNSLKVSSVLTGIGTAVQTIGALQPAYHALKTAAAAFGLPSP